MTDPQDAIGPTRNIALMIDGDNAQPSLIAGVLAEAAKYGTITVRRIYGDWTAVGIVGNLVVADSDPSRFGDAGHGLPGTTASETKVSRRLIEQDGTNDEEHFQVRRFATWRSGNRPAG